MPKAKDTKVWNEDLVMAFGARAEQALSQGKTTHIFWRQAAATIQEVRKDIYRASTGRVFNLPENKLCKTALRLARDIIEGKQDILPAGYIPTNQQQAELMGDRGNWDYYPYVQSIKIRGGAFAILLAFHNSATKTLSKDQICQLAQPYCDEEMEANWHAGRAYGGWSSNATLLKHGLIAKEGGDRLYVPGVGFRSTTGRFTLTRDGEKFTEALLRKVAKDDPTGAAIRGHNFVTTTAEAATLCSLQHDSPQRRANQEQPGRKKATELMEKDELELREWLRSASINQQKTFDVGKERRQNLHNLCVSLQQEIPGLKLHHSSAGGGRGRILYISIVVPPSSRVNSTTFFPSSPTKRPHSPQPFTGKGCKLSPTKKLRNGIPAGMAAAEAAVRRASIARRLDGSQAGKSTECYTRGESLMKRADNDHSFFGDEAKPPPQARRQLFDEVVDLLYDSEDGGFIPSPSGMARPIPAADEEDIEERKKPAVNRESDQQVIDLCDSSQEADESDLDEQTKMSAVVNPYKKNESTNVETHMTYCIDDRERNRNSSPRLLRTELTRLLLAGPLKSIWPSDMTTPSIEETALRFGDFSFLLGSRRLDIAIERKQIRDLVQRSTSGAHWNQLVKMRDRFRHFVFLVETDPRQAARFEAHGAQRLDGWNPFDTVINDESSVYLFMARALFSGAKFHQTREFQGSLRAIGALGLMASRLGLTVEEDPEKHVYTENDQYHLTRRLIDSGIPAPIADSVGREYGSMKNLNSLYESCSTDKCRSRLLIPVAKHVDMTAGAPDGSACSWSDAVFRSLHSVHPDYKSVLSSLQKYAPLVEDYGMLLAALHSYIDPEAALESVLSCSKRDKESQRRVVIDICQDEAEMFPSSIGTSFYSLHISPVPPFGSSIPTISFMTTDQTFQSSRVVVQIFSGDSFVQEVKSVMIRTQVDFTRKAQVAAACIMNIARADGIARNDTRVFLLRGLSPAIDAEAKRPGYKAELKMLLDLVVVDLMLEHNITVIQAFRLSGDTELILQQLALACFHYQLLTSDKTG